MDTLNTIPEKEEIVTLILPDEPEFISLARMSASVMANRAGLDIDEIEDLKVALSEACTNALRYGCSNEKFYEVQFILKPEYLEITVTDKGEGFDSEQIVEPVIGGDQIGGFGIFLIRSLMDRTEIKSKKGQGTKISLYKNLRSKNGDEKPAIQG